jgi:hypothetical protein
MPAGISGASSASHQRQNPRRPERCANPLSQRPRSGFARSIRLRRIVGRGGPLQRLALLPEEHDHRLARIVLRTDDGVAGEGYTIGRCRFDVDPPHRRLSIPNHKELAKGTLRGLIREAGLTVDEFVRLL